MDSDSENKNTNQPEAQSQGIFSTPELTVDAEKIAQNAEATNEASRAKIASIFANTETGKQSQRLNDAMMVNSQPATEDVVINNGPRKKSKLPIILAAIVLIAVVVGGVGYFVVGNLPQKQEVLTPTAAFDNYFGYLKDGSEGMRDSAASDEWVFFQVGRSASFSDATTKSYINELQSKYTAFTNSITDSIQDGNYGDVNMAQYQRFFDVFNVVAMLKNTKQELLDKYLDAGKNAAYTYTDSVAPVIPDDEQYRALTRISNAITNYLETELSLIEIYESWGCINDHILDTACGTEFSEGNSAFADLMTQQASSERTITSYSQVLQEPFMNMTDSLSQKVKEQ